MVPLQIEVIDEASKVSLDHVWEEGRMSATNQLIARKNLSINSICTDIVTQSDVSPPNLGNLNQFFDPSAPISLPLH
jgi:hypothetical protein